MEKMKPLLISDGAERVQREIDEHRNRARFMTELIQAYNRLPHLGNIDTALEAREFLSNPVSYLNECIDNQLSTGTFTGKVRPEAARVAELYGIPYTQILQRINMTSPYLRTLDRFGFDEEKIEIFLLPEGEETIKEFCKVWMTNEQEIELYRNIQAVCDKLNSLCDMFGNQPFEKNTAARQLGFLNCVTQGRDWTFVPNVERLRAYLARESTKKA